MTDSLPPPAEDESVAVDERATPAALSAHLGPSPGRRDPGDHAPRAHDDPTVDRLAAEASERPANQLAARRQARRRRRLPPPVVAAAFVVAAGLGLFLVLSGRAQRHQRQAERRSSMSQPAAGSGGHANAQPNPGVKAPAGATPSSVATTVPALTVPALGTYPDRPALIEALGRVDPATLRLPGPTASSGTASMAKATTVPGAEVTRCEVVARGHGPRQADGRLAVATAAIGRQRLLVYAFQAPAAGSSPAATMLLAVDRTSCYPVVARLR